jgi:molecular chaperone DnaK
LNNLKEFIMNKVARVCGIDLGTTFSAISWFDPTINKVDAIDLVNAADGAKILRSVVYYPGEGEEPVVGDTAWNCAKLFPDRVITGIKRQVGTNYTHPPIDGKEYNPQEVQSEILKVLVKEAGNYFGSGSELTDVVITVPAWFGDNERAETKEAGEKAGLNILALLPEPHAAALAYSIEQAVEIVDKYLLVYDLGGGTFDVTLIHVTAVDDAEGGVKLKIDTIAKDGSRELGGLDWDKALAGLVSDKVTEEFETDVMSDAVNVVTLMDNCEKSKRDLSRTKNVAIVADTANHQVSVSRSEFEQCADDLLQRTEMLCVSVLDEAEKEHNITKDQIEVMLTGGSSKMPIVKTMIEGMMNKPAMSYHNPELLVTFGAAYWAYIKKFDSPVIIKTTTSDGGVEEVPVSLPGDDSLNDISMYGIGIEAIRKQSDGTEERYIAEVIPSGAKTGIDFSKMFRTAKADMREIKIRLYSFDSFPAGMDECKFLLEVIIANLPENLPQGEQVGVTLKYDQSGIIQGSAKLVKTGEVVDIVIERK